ncbi:MAG: hypothetical protein AMXMBFR64_04650 [Myxococcales bacterium]
MDTSRYIVGIDLGTTNTAVAYVDTEGDGVVHLLELPQLVRLGHVEARPTLPSFVYLANPGELPPGSLRLPWDGGAGDAVGVLARDHGAKVPARLVSSAKSWLSHGGVDRRAPILPLGLEDAERRISPLDASARVLRHVRDAWNHLMGVRLEEQSVLLTVPASFDPVARELTMAAAREAGLDAVLLEEPQAALYAWLGDHEGWRKQVSAGDVILVCDVGGGTTDFSLIQVRDEGGDLVLERVAVGDHILLGGDNMDLALAHLVQAQLEEQGTRLDAWQSRELWHACREAKEALLSGGAESHPITVLGRGSRLIGGAIKSDVWRDDVEAVVLDGFFPRCGADERPARRRAAGLRELGLPYAADPGVTKHLAEFLGRHAGAGAATAVLFNGGVFRADALRGRVIEALDGWAREGGGASVKVLDGANLDLAVARGAAWYGLVRRGKGLRIRGGTARSYYVGVESSMPAVPGMAPPMRALCVAPFGMEEGTEAAVAEREFGLVVGEPVEFRFLASTTRADDRVGDMVDARELSELTPLEVTLDEGADGQVVPVRIHVRVTEVGTLEVWCQSRGGDRWKVELETRAEGAR